MDPSSDIEETLNKNNCRPTSVSRERSVGHLIPEDRD